MAHKLKPVDDSPICDPAYVRRIDPVWMPGKVPSRFWEDRKHRRDYILWLGKRLHFRRMYDFYRLTARTVLRNRGRTPLTYWRSATFRALKDVFPEYDWLEWLFPHVPKGFWEPRTNRRRYLAWLGEHLGYKCADDWYALTENEFLQNRGKGILLFYRSSPVRLVIDLLPGRNWYEWKFNNVPGGFWDVAENRHRYLRWLGKELGYRKPTDWYRITSLDVRTRHGAALLDRFASFMDLMREFLPDLDWDSVDYNLPISIDEILVWADAYYARHGEWPTQTSGKIPGSRESWSAIDVCLRDGFRGLPGGSSLPKFLQKYRGVPIGRKPPKLTEEQILAWADAHFAASGRWPTASSSATGTNVDWLSVQNAMRMGLRGLSPGRSLAQFLAERRGARNHMRLPPLKVKQILEWAKAFHQATGRWPRPGDGPIAQSPGDSWTAVIVGLSQGHRGLPGGSSLAKLLRKHGLK
jgi:hypothetical protein